MKLGYTVDTVDRRAQVELKSERVQAPALRLLKRWPPPPSPPPLLRQGLTLVHFSAQRKRFVWHRGCI